MSFGVGTTGSSDCLFTTANLASPVLRTICMWLKATVLGAGIFRSIHVMNDAGPTHTQGQDILTSDHLQLAQTGGTSVEFSSGNPTFTNWIFYAMTAGAAGANSIIQYFCDNASGALTSQSTTGLASWTPTAMALGAYATSGTGPFADVYNLMEWDSVLSPTQLLAQKKQFAPVTVTALRRWMKGLNGATAGTDSSGNGFSMTNSGTLVDGASNPSFGLKVQPALLFPRSVYV